MKIGIFGGTFDPIHFGHIHAIAYALDRKELDEIHVVVAGDPYQKSDVIATSEQRFNWASRAVDQFFPAMQNVIVDDIELKRSGPTYTIDTLRHFEKECPGSELVLVVGEDIVDTISTWKDYEKIMKISELFVVPRSIVTTSSSYIRQMLSEKRPITGLIPSDVEREIIEKGLYN